eukprot:gene6458-6479_t
MTMMIKGKRKKKKKKKKKGYRFMRSIADKMQKQMRCPLMRPIMERRRMEKRTKQMGKRKEHMGKRKKH